MKLAVHCVPGMPVIGVQATCGTTLVILACVLKPAVQSTPRAIVVGTKATRGHTAVIFPQCLPLPSGTGHKGCLYFSHRPPYTPCFFIQACVDSASPPPQACETPRRDSRSMGFVVSAFGTKAWRKTSVFTIIILETIIIP